MKTTANQKTFIDFLKDKSSAKKLKSTLIISLKNLIPTTFKKFLKRLKRLPDDYFYLANKGKKKLFNKKSRVLNLTDKYLEKDYKIIKVSIVGWYGEGAHGDDIMEIATRNAFISVARRYNCTLKFVSEKEADVVIVGGGTILGVDTMNLYSKLARIDTPIVIFGGGFRRERRDIGNENRDRMKKLFERASLKGVRGYLSKQFLIHCGIDADDIDVIGDPAFLFEPVKIKPLSNSFKVGVSVRNMRTGEPQYATNEENWNVIAKICDNLTKFKNAKLYFFNFAENVHDSDSEGIKKVISLMENKKNYTILPFKKTPEYLFSMLGQMDYIVSQRLHPTILGWIQGVPHVALEYQFGKTADFMQSIGMGEFVVRTDEFGMDTYIKKMERIMREKELIKHHSLLSVNYWKKKQYEFISRIMDMFIHK